MTSFVRQHINRPLLVCAFALFLSSVGVAGNAWASSLNIDFAVGGTFSAPPASTYGAAAGQPGVWNNIIGPTPPVPLANLAGGASGATVQVNAFANNFQNPFSVVGGDAELLSDYFYTVDGVPFSVNFTGLQNGPYAVFLYAPNASNVPIGAGSINGVPWAFTPGGLLQVPGLVPGLHYTVVDNVFVTNGTMSILSNGGSQIVNYGLSGVQLQLVPTVTPMPEPTTMLLVGTGLAFAIRRRLQKKR